MSETNPIQSVFGFQRTIVEQTHKATVDSLEAQKTAFEQFADGLETIEQLQTQGTEMNLKAVHAYFDAIEQANPEADLAEMREMVDEQFETVEENQAQSWDAVIEAIEESTDGFEEAVDTYTETVDSSFDGFLEAHEQLEDNAAAVSEQVEEVTPDTDEFAN